MLAITVEQLFKLIQQHTRLWSRPDGLSKIYAQTADLAEHIDSAYRQSPNKFIAQLHIHKPHFDLLTNLTAKAVIFAADQVSQLHWTTTARHSIIAATLTFNVSILPHLLKQSRGEPLTGKQKLAVLKSARLSHRLLVEHKVLDPLWLQAVIDAGPPRTGGQYAVGLAGAIVRYAYRFAKPLCRPNSVGKVSIGQILREVFLNEANPQCVEIVSNAAKRIHNLGSGAMVLLNNDQAALLLHQTAPTQYLAFMFASEQITSKGRFIEINDKHIKATMPLYQYEDPRLYSQLWEAPLARFISDKDISLAPAIIELNPQLETPPKLLGTLLSNLFEDPDIHKLSQQIAQSEQLSQLLNQTASAASAKKLTISDPKHAIAMLGLNRIGPLLTQGALAQQLAQLHFASRSWLQNRQDCLLQAVRFYGKYNDYSSNDELAMYCAFYFAPFYCASSVQLNSGSVHLQRTIEVNQAFDLACLFATEANEKHQQQLIALAENWQLPKFGHELFRQLSNTNGNLKAARTITTALAVIRLACFHCHTIFNQVDINNPWLQQQLRQQLAHLDLSFERFLAMQDQFLLDYSPFTPLL